MSSTKNLAGPNKQTIVKPPRCGKTLLSTHLEKAYKALSEEFPKVEVVPEINSLSVVYRTESGVEVLLGISMLTDSEKVVEEFIETCKTILRGFVTKKDPLKLSAGLEHHLTRKEM